MTLMINSTNKDQAVRFIGGHYNTFADIVRIIWNLVEKSVLYLCLNCYKLKFSSPH